MDEGGSKQKRIGKEEVSKEGGGRRRDMRQELGEENEKRWVKEELIKNLNSIFVYFKMYSYVF